MAVTPRKGRDVKQIIITVLLLVAFAAVVILLAEDANYPTREEVSR